MTQHPSRRLGLLVLLGILLCCFGDARAQRLWSLDVYRSDDAQLIGANPSAETLRQMLRRQEAPLFRSAAVRLIGLTGEGDRDFILAQARRFASPGAIDSSVAGWFNETPPSPGRVQLRRAHWVERTFDAALLRGYFGDQTALSSMDSVASMGYGPYVTFAMCQLADAGQYNHFDQLMRMVQRGGIKSEYLGTLNCYLNSTEHRQAMIEYLSQLIREAPTYREFYRAKDVIVPMLARLDSARALSEVISWAEAHPGHNLTAWVEANRLDPARKYERLMVLIPASAPQESFFRDYLIGEYIHGGASAEFIHFLTEWITQEPDAELRKLLRYYIQDPEPEMPPCSRPVNAGEGIDTLRRTVQAVTGYGWLGPASFEQQLLARLDGLKPMVVQGDTAALIQGIARFMNEIERAVLAPDAPVPTDGQTAYVNRSAGHMLWYGAWRLNRCITESIDYPYPIERFYEIVLGETPRPGSDTLYVTPDTPLGGTLDWHNRHVVVRPNAAGAAVVTLSGTARLSGTATLTLRPGVRFGPSGSGARLTLLSTVPVALDSTAQLTVGPGGVLRLDSIGTVTIHGGMLTTVGTGRLEAPSGATLLLDGTGPGGIRAQGMMGAVPLRLQGIVTVPLDSLAGSGPVTVAPGARLRFGSGAGLVLSAPLTALGTVGQPIRFGPTGATAPSSWRGIVLRSSANQMAGCTVEGAEIGLQLAGKPQAPLFGSTVGSSTFRSCTVGLSVEWSDLSLTGSTLSDSRSVGLALIGSGIHLLTEGNQIVGLTPGSTGLYTNGADAQLYNTTIQGNRTGVLATGGGQLSFGSPQLYRDEPLPCPAPEDPFGTDPPGSYPVYTKGYNQISGNSEYGISVGLSTQTLLGNVYYSEMECAEGRGTVTYSVALKQAGYNSVFGNGLADAYAVSTAQGSAGPQSAMFTWWGDFAGPTATQVQPAALWNTSQWLSGAPMGDPQLRLGTLTPGATAHTSSTRRIRPISAAYLSWLRRQLGAAATSDSGAAKLTAVGFEAIRLLREAAGVQRAAARPGAPAAAVGTWAASLRTVPLAEWRPLVEAAQAQLLARGGQSARAARQMALSLIALQVAEGNLTAAAQGLQSLRSVPEMTGRQPGELAATATERRERWLEDLDRVALTWRLATAGPQEAATALSSFTQAHPTAPDAALLGRISRPARANRVPVKSGSVDR